MMIRALFLMSLTALIGCGSTPRTLTIQPSPAASLLRAVPADTAYFLGSFDRFPDPLGARQLKLLRNVMREGATLLSESPDAMRSGFARWTVAFSTLMQTKLTPDGLREIGLGPRPDFMFYGLDLMPVLRVSLEDGNRLRAVVEQSAQTAGLSITWQQHGAWSVWQVADSQLGAVVAIRPKALAVGVYLKDELDTYLPQLLGEVLPERAMTPTDIDAFLTRRRYQPWNFGWVSVAQMIMPNSRLGRAVAADGPTCEIEVRQILSTLPRMEFGVRSASATGYDGHMYMPIETGTRPTLAAILKPARGPAALKRVDGIFLSLGFDVPTLLDVLSNWGAGRLKTPYQCRALNFMNELAQNAAALPVPYQLQKIDGIAMAMPGGMVAEVMPEAALVAYAESVQPVVSLLATYLPFLAQLPEGTAHPIPVPMPAPVHYLQVSTAIGASIGMAGATRLQTLVQQKTESDAFLIGHMDERFVQVMEQAQDRHLPPEERRSEAERRMSEATATNDLYYFFGRLGAAGIDIDVRVRFQDTQP